MEKTAKIFVAGHSGMVGSGLVRKLKQSGYANIISPSRSELDLLDQLAVASFFQKEEPQYVFFAAGKVGGIYANNTYRADFLYENVTMQSNVIHQSFLHDVRKLMYFSCSCIYPKDCCQPMREEDILSGKIESTNEPFAIAKIAGLKMCESYNRQYGTEFFTLIPTNIYGPNQRYEPMNSLVIPSLIQKFREARQLGKKQVTIWGSGKPARDFLFADDLADASIFLMENFEGNLLLNVGTGEEITISRLAEIIRKEVGFDGEIVYEGSLPDGVSQKLQDISRIRDLGWKHKISIEEGIHLAYLDYLEKYPDSVPL